MKMPMTRAAYYVIHTRYADIAACFRLQASPPPAASASRVSYCHFRHVIATALYFFIYCRSRYSA